MTHSLSRWLLIVYLFIFVIDDWNKYSEEELLDSNGSSHVKHWPRTQADNSSHRTDHHLWEDTQRQLSEWLLGLLPFSSHHGIAEERGKKGLTRCTFYTENCYCSPLIIWPTIWEERCAKERGALMGGREPTQGQGRRERIEGGGGGWSLALRRRSVGKCRMDVSFSLWGELCIWLLFLSVFQGPDPRGHGQREIPLYVFACVK